MSPELDSRPLATELLEPDPIDSRDPATVCDRVAALDRFPGIELLRPVLRFLGRMPTDRRGIEKNVGALKSGQPGAFRIPLVPAHERANWADLRVKRSKAEIAGRGIKLSVIGGIIGG